MQKFLLRGGWNPHSSGFMGVRELQPRMDTTSTYAEMNITQLKENLEDLKDALGI